MSHLDRLRASQDSSVLPSLMFAKSDDWNPSQICRCVILGSNAPCKNIVSELQARLIRFRRAFCLSVPLTEPHGRVMPAALLLRRFAIGNDFKGVPVQHSAHPTGRAFDLYGSVQSRYALSKASACLPQRCQVEGPSNILP